MNESTTKPAPRPVARLVLRVFVEAPDAERTAKLLQATIAPTLEAHARVALRRIERYWKIPQWHEVTLDLATHGDPGAAYDALLRLSPAHWSSSDFETHRDAVWNPHDGSTFLAPEVRWAHLEMWLEEPDRGNTA